MSYTPTLGTATNKHRHRTSQMLVDCPPCCYGFLAMLSSQLLPPFLNRKINDSQTTVLSTYKIKTPVHGRAATFIVQRYCSHGFPSIRRSPRVNHVVDISKNSSHRSCDGGFNSNVPWSIVNKLVKGLDARIHDLVCFDLLAGDVSGRRNLRRPCRQG